MQRFISQFSFSLGEHRLVHMAQNNNPEQPQAQPEAKEAEVAPLETPDDLGKAVAKRAETATADTAAAAKSAAKTAETGAKLDVPAADMKGAAARVDEVLRKIDTPSPTAEGPTKSAERSPEAVRMQKEMAKQMEIRENQKRGDASSETFAMSRFGKVDKSGAPFIYKNDTVTIGGKEVKALVAFAPTGGLQYMLEGETKWRSPAKNAEGDAIRAKFANDIQSYVTTTERQKKDIKKEKGEDGVATLERRNADNEQMEQFLVKPDAQTSDFNRGAEYWEGLENGAVRVSIEDAMARKDEPATEVKPEATPSKDAATTSPSESTQSVNELSLEMRRAVEYAKSSLGNLEQYLSMGFGMNIEAEAALAALNKVLDPLSPADKQNVILALGLGAGRVIESQNNNTRYFIRADDNGRAVVLEAPLQAPLGTAAPAEKKPEAPKPADTKTEAKPDAAPAAPAAPSRTPDAPKPAEGMTPDKIETIKNSKEYQQALVPLRKGIGELIDIVMREPNNKEAITAKTKEITDSFAGLSKEHKDVMIATYDEQNTVDFAKEGYQLVIKFNPKTPSVTIERKNLPVAAPAEGSPATPDVPADAAPVAPVEGATETPADTTRKGPGVSDKTKKQITDLEGKIADIDAQIATENEKNPPDVTVLDGLLKQKEPLQAELDALKRLQEKLDKVPETKGQQLEQNLEKGLQDLKEAQTPAESFAAIMKVLATIIEYMKSAFNGTLEDKLDKPKDAAGDKKEGADGKTALAKKLDGELKDRAEQTKETDPAKIREGLKQEKLDTIKKNNETLKTLDGDVEKTKKEKMGLLDQKLGIEKKLTELGTDESKTEEVKSLKIQLDTVTKQIALIDESITAIDKQRDELAKANKQLETEVAALESRETGIGVLENVLGRLNALIKEKGLNIAIKIEQTDGKNILVLEGLTVEQAKLIDPAATTGTLRIDPSNPPAILGGKSEKPADTTAQPAETKEQKVTVNELQQRRERAIQNQADSLLKDDLGITKMSEGTVYSGVEFGADYYNSKDFRVRFDRASTQWQIRPDGVETWQQPMAYVANDPENRQIVQRLNSFNEELGRLQKDVTDAEAAEKTA